jgi:hypothetical protein
MIINAPRSTLRALPNMSGKADPFFAQIDVQRGRRASDQAISFQQLPAVVQPEASRAMSEILAGIKPDSGPVSITGIDLIFDEKTRQHLGYSIRGTAIATSGWEVHGMVIGINRDGTRAFVKKDDWYIPR